MVHCPQDPPGTLWVHSNLRTPTPSPLPPRSEALSLPGQLHFRGRIQACLSGGDVVGPRSCLPNHGWEMGRLEGRASSRPNFRVSDRPAVVLHPSLAPGGPVLCSKYKVSGPQPAVCPPPSPKVVLGSSVPQYPMFPTLPSRHPPSALSLSALAFLFSAGGQNSPSLSAFNLACGTVSLPVPWSGV